MNVWAMIEGRVWALVVPDRFAEGKSPPRTKRRAPRWRVDGRLGGAKDGRLGGAKVGASVARVRAASVSVPT